MIETKHFAASTERSGHEHRHDQNRFAVIPTPVRLDADERYRGRNVTIAFLDSGFYPHRDLASPKNRIIAYKDITGEEPTLDARSPARGWQWHGTQTAVAAAGNGNLSDGIYRGLASEANVVLVKVGSKGRITEENIERGLRWVIESQRRFDIRIISISLGGNEDIPCTKSIIDLAAEEAVESGMLVVAAAGNNGCSDKHTSVPPANSPSVITVGGYNDNNQLQGGAFDLYCSNYGETADGITKPEIIAPAMWVAAPILPNASLYKTAQNLSRIASAPDYELSGMARAFWQETGLSESLQYERPEKIRAEIEALLIQNKIISAHYQHVDGTSFAAPIVSSVVAQMLEANPRLSPAAVRNILVSTADRITHAPAIRQGYGRLNARRAVRMAQLETHALSAADGFGPPRIKKDKLVFFYHHDDARTVSVAGDFNDWDAEMTPLRREPDGIWGAEIDAPPAGRYRYKFIVNGEYWLDDPHNGFKESDGFGGFNSILNAV
ncbi:MAG TPA: S8 family serine peptidase [Pyrinomonadaceae bacterium]|nr:S8 family serine peptidase [Pyrinomonadaceae bacterium]